jgi:enediyne biosynthesis protein E4
MVSVFLRTAGGWAAIGVLLGSWGASLSGAGPTADAPSNKPAGDAAFVFSDVGDEAGVFPHVAGIRGHAAAWGDVDENGWPDLYVGTFHNAGSKPGMLLRNREGKFTLDPQPHLLTTGIGSGALFMDLDNDGRLELFVSNCAHGGKEPLFSLPSMLFRNDGDGKFTDISETSGACLPNYAGRGLAALDFDGDGLLDFITCEQYYSSNVKVGPALFRNLGNLRFENVAEAAGLPTGLGGLAVAAADVNNDGWPDLFLTHGGGEHRLMLNDGRGRFAEAPETRDVFRWKLEREDNTPAGVCIADVNRDGLADIVIGHHFKSPWTTPEPIRLYLNRGVKNGVPRFENVTEQAGLEPLLMKAPHVEIQDFDNDGRPDIYTSIVKFKEGRPYPLIYKNLGSEGGVPRFREDAWGVNDFPTSEDRAIKRSGPLFDKILEEKKIMYMAPGPSADFNRDGKLDLFLANWWIESRSLLLRNEMLGGRWLDVRVEGKNGVNRMGIGTRVNVYPAGEAGRAKALLGSREIAAGYGYCSGQEAVAHFGLGEHASVDVEVILPHGQGRIVKLSVPADQRITVTQ